MRRTLIAGLVLAAAAAALFPARPSDASYHAAAPVGPYVEINHGTSTVVSDGDDWRIKIDVNYAFTNTDGVFVVVDVFNEDVDDWDRLWVAGTVLYAWFMPGQHAGQPCVQHFEFTVPKNTYWGGVIGQGGYVAVEVRLSPDPTLYDSGLECRD